MRPRKRLRRIKNSLVSHDCAACTFPPFKFNFLAPMLHAAMLSVQGMVSQHVMRGNTGPVVVLRRGAKLLRTCTQERLRMLRRRCCQASSALRSPMCGARRPSPYQTWLKEDGACGQPSQGLLGGAFVLVSLLQGGYLVRGGRLLPGRGADVPRMRPATADLSGRVFCESRGMLFHRLVALLSF